MEGGDIPEMENSVDSILTDTSVPSLQKRLLEAQNRISFLKGRLEQAEKAGGGGGGGGMGQMSPLMLMAAMGGGGGGGPGGGEEGEGGINKMAQMMMLQQNPMLAATSGADLRNPASMLGGLQGGSSDIALSPLAQAAKNGIDPVALMALVKGKGRLGEMLEREQAPPPIIDEELGAPLLVAAERLLQAGVGDHLGEGWDAVIRLRGVPDILFGDGEGRQGIGLIGHGKVFLLDRGRRARRSGDALIGLVG